MEVFRTPDSRFEGLPGYDFEPHYAEVDGLRMHYVDEGEGQPVVMFHGEPSWAYLYRKMIPPVVASGRRAVVPDLAGFGRSDKPVDHGWYSYDRHFSVVSEVLAGLDLRDAVVVVQDWGGPIGLRWALSQEERVAGLVVLNTGLFTGRVSKGFMAWREFAARTPDLPIGLVVQGATATELSPDVVAAYEAPFPSVESKGGAATFPLLVPTSDEDEGASVMKAVTEELASWSKPCLVAFSDSDPVFPFPRSGERFVDLIPGAGEQVRIEGAAHFLQEDAGEEIARLMLAWLEKQPQGGEF
jgi:haloalkane dehalogenase